MGFMKKHLKLAVGVLCVLPLIGLADPPSNSGGGGGGGREEQIRGADSRPGGGEGEMPRRRPGDRFREFSPSDEQIAKAEAFVQEHSPNRYKAYKKPGPNRPFLVKAIVRGYYELKAIEIDDPALYAMKLDQLSKEDEIFGLVAAARETQLPKDKLRAQVRPLVKELLAKRKEEMQHRIDKLEMAKMTEMRRLNELNDVGETWIDNRIDEEMSRNGRFMHPGSRRLDRQSPKATSSASD
jgi:uncharacterized coiled-coil protein SlyX